MNDELEQIKKEIERRQEVQHVKECISCAHEGLLVTTLDGMIVETAPAAEHILDRPSVGLKGHDIHEFCAAREGYDDIRR